MKKGEFMRWQAVADRLKSNIFNHWTHWLQDNGRAVPDVEHWYYEKQGDSIVVYYDGKKDEIPVQEFHGEDHNPLDLKMLWHTTYIDGPLSGIAEFNGDLVYFTCHEDEFDNIFGIRTYGLYRLSLEEQLHEVRWHQLFQTYVGYGCDHGDKYRPFRDQDAVNPEYFYNELAPKRLFTDYLQNNELIREVEYWQFKNYDRQEKKS